jgi:hypothetical protein
LCTEKLLQTEAFTHGSFFARAYAFTHSKLLHREAFAEKLLLREAVTQRSFCTEKPSHPRSSQRPPAFTQKSFYKEKLLHGEKLSNRKAFTQSKPLHTEPFTQRSFYTEQILQGADFRHMLLHAIVLTYRCFYTQTLLHEKLLDREALTQINFE